MTMEAARTALLPRGTDWKLIRDDWDEQTIMLAYSRYAELRVLTKWAYVATQQEVTTIDDLQGAALDGLWRAAKRWRSWNIERGRDHLDKVNLLYFVNQNIDWTVADFLNKYKLAENSYEGMSSPETGEALDARLIRTQLHQRESRSQLQGSIVDYIQTMRPPEQLILALRFFDELTVDSIAKLTGRGVPNTSAAISRASGKVLAYALTEVVDDPDEPPTSNTRGYIPADTLVNWIHAHYGTTLTNYLAYAAACYRVDVSYLVDILDRGNGDVHKTPRYRGTWGKLSEEQCQEIEVRIAAGETQVSIAKAFGVTDSAISYQARRRTVA